MMAEKPARKRTPFKLFLVYFLCFFAALVTAFFVLTRMIEEIRAGEYLLLLLPPLAGMAVFHGLFPLLSRLRLGLEFVAVGGGLVYGLGALLALLARSGAVDPGTATVFWLAGVFGPGWWLMLGRAEKAGYFQ